MKLRIIIPIVSFCTVVALAMSVHLPAQAQQQSKLIEFDAPDAGTSAGQGTRPSTNNLSGAVTGWWVDGNGLNHGFVWYAGWALLPGANSGQYR